MTDLRDCPQSFEKTGEGFSYEPVTGVREVENLSASFDHMVKKIQNFCRKTSQPVPETVGQIAHCIYESLALKYRWALERLEEIKGERIGQLNIVGGGIQNKLLNQMAADAIDRPVVTGPIEGAAIGNLLAQAMALGEIRTMDELRDVVRASEPVSRYEPNHTPAWQAAYTRLLSLL